MKAAVRRQYGPPETLKIESIDKPIPKDDEVLIRVHATTVNRTDCAVLTGKPMIMRLFTGLTKPKSIVPGTDFAGVVEAVGDKVDNYNSGDRVFGFHDDGLGSQAEYMTYSVERAMTKIPDGLSFDVAAASLEGAHYAYNGILKSDVKSGQKILVNGATGAIGSASLQMLKHMGVYVTAVANTKNIELIQSLGADKVYDYEREDFTTDDEKYDCVFDAVGKSSFGKCKSLLKDKGIYISTELGPRAENPFLALVTPLGGGKKVIFPIPFNIQRSVLHIKDLLEKAAFKPVIDRNYLPEEISEAYCYVASGQKTGNVVIQWSSAD